MLRQRTTLRNHLLDQWNIVAVGICGLTATFIFMVTLHDAYSLGAVAFTPWIALLAIRLGATVGVVSAITAAMLYLIAIDLNGFHMSSGQLFIRLLAMVCTGLIAGALHEPRIWAHLSNNDWVPTDRLEIDKECQWLDAQTAVVSMAIQSNCEPEVAREADLALSRLSDRARALTSLAEVVDQAACHQGESAGCLLVAKTAREAKFITDLGYHESIG